MSNLACMINLRPGVGDWSNALLGLPSLGPWQVSQKDLANYYSPQFARLERSAGLCSAHFTGETPRGCITQQSRNSRQRAGSGSCTRKCGNRSSLVEHLSQTLEVSGSIPDGSRYPFQPIRPGPNAEGTGPRDCFRVNSSEAGHHTKALFGYCKQQVRSTAKGMGVEWD